MTNVTISGMTQEQFFDNVKSAIETHTGSTIKKNHLITKAVTTILAQSNEHTIPLVFSKNTGPVMPGVNDKPVTYDASRYSVNEYDMGIHGMLDVDSAQRIIDYVYMSEFWFLAPLMDGIFDIKEEALSFVEQFPGHALSIVVSTNSDAGCVSAIINSHADGFFLLDDEEHRIIKGSESPTLESLFEKIQSVMSGVAAKQNGDADYYAIPYITKESPFVDYIIHSDYLRSVYGSLDRIIAKQLVELIYQSNNYKIGTTDGTPFDNKDEAQAFIDIFDEHPMIVLAELEDSDGWLSYGALLLITSADGVIYFGDLDELGHSFSDVANNIEELKEKLPALAAQIGNADFPAYNGTLSTKPL